MALTKRQQQQEKKLIKALTAVCESAKSQIPGFKWLTHDHDQSNFPKGLRVVWVFDSQQSMAHAMQTGLDELMMSLSRDALHAANLNMNAAQLSVAFDNEEACKQLDQGDWAIRLARSRRLI